MSKLASFATATPRNVRAYMFDRMLGVSTRGTLITADSIFAVGGDNLPYAGVEWLPVRHALMNLAPGPTDVFVDLGSGKGKAVLIAGQLPYGRVIGVEIDEGLARCAEDNVRQARARLRAKEVTIVASSVLEWPIPEETSVVFMYNPFLGQTFRSMVGRIIESYDRRPRNLHIIYCLPAEHNWLVSTGRVVVEHVRPSYWPWRFGWWRTGNVIVTYRVVGVSEGASPQPTRDRSSRLDRATQYWTGPNGYRFMVK